MISVCIPVYNYPITPLAGKLSLQAVTCKHPVEIVFLDDGSDETFKIANRKVATLPKVVYQEQENKGRSGARNQLASISKGETLIFIDTDCDVQSYFLSKYTEHLQSDAVVVGGLEYPPKPEDKTRHLRWTTGTRREVKTVEQRRLHPHHCFLSSNFMIPRKLYNQHTFDLTLEGYGHEDTLFGMALKESNVHIVHIHNPVIHLGIDSVEIYLKKLQESIRNLIRIRQMNIDLEPIKLMRYYGTIRKLKMKKPVAWVFSSLQPALKNYFLKGGDSLFLLDIYKIGLLCRLDHL